MYETDIMSYLYESYKEWIEHKVHEELASKCRRRQNDMIEWPWESAVSNCHFQLCHLYFVTFRICYYRILLPSATFVELNSLKALRRCKWWLLDLACVGDKFEMLVTDFLNVTNIVTNIVILPLKF